MNEQEQREQLAVNLLSPYAIQRWGVHKVLLIAERFISKTNEPTAIGCIEWSGWRNTQGYGGFYINENGNDVSFRAHRVAWMLWRGEILDGLHVCHSCDNPPCVNHQHLWLGTNQENIKDAVANGLTAKGEDFWAAKLKESDVIAIRNAYCQNRRLRHRQALATQYGVSIKTIEHVVYRNTWKHI